MSYEVWKDVVGYEGLYQISNLGRVKSMERFRKGKKGSKTYCKERILKSRISNAGYYQVCVCKNSPFSILRKHLHDCIKKLFVSAKMFYFQSEKVLFVLLFDCEPLPPGKQDKTKSQDEICYYIYFLEIHEPDCIFFFLC